MKKRGDELDFDEIKKKLDAEINFDELKKMLDADLGDIQVSEELIAATLNKIKQAENVVQPSKQQGVLEVPKKSKHPWYRNSWAKAMGGFVAACFVLFIGGSIYLSNNDSGKKSENSKKDSMESDCLIQEATETADNQSKDTLYPAVSEGGEQMDDMNSQLHSKVIGEEVQQDAQTNSITLSDADKTILCYDMGNDPEKASEIMTLVPSDDVNLVEELTDETEGNIAYQIVITKEKTTVMEYTFYRNGGIVVIFHKESGELSKVTYQAKDIMKFLDKINNIIDK